MNRAALGLALLSAPLLVIVPVLASSLLVPSMLALGVAILGALGAIAGAASGRVRLHAGGLLLAVGAASLTGPAIETTVLLAGVLGVVFGLASLNLHLELPEDAGAVALIAAALVMGVVVALGGYGLALVVHPIGGGGVDALGGLPALIVLVASVTWFLYRWSSQAEADAS